MNIFFYGLFMDEQLLASKGIRPTQTNLGFLENYQLRIGERATLLHRPGSVAYGIVMDIEPVEAESLYAEDSVADYLPETVTVELMDGSQVEATCYNLPADKVQGTNREYAALLLTIASSLGFPESYLDQIRLATTQRH